MGLVISMDEMTRNALSRLPAPVEQFFRTYCREPEELVEALLPAPAERVMEFSDGRRICAKGDSADCLWIVVEGSVRIISDGQLVAKRTIGELVGEQSLYRRSQSQRRRGADMVAEGEVELWQIDLLHIEALSERHQALWHETMCRLLTQKLDDAVDQRRDMRAQTTRLKDLIGRFVCENGKSAVWPTIKNGGHVTPEKCDVLVWFSDLAGFSKWATGKPPHEVAAVVRKFMDMQVAEISAADGQIDKFIGDGLMAFWRVPDAPRREIHIPAAVGAALAVGDKVRALADELAIPLDIRIGLHVGAAFIGDFGGGDRISFTVIGDAINTASRYEQEKKDTKEVLLGRVRISEAVYEEIKGHQLAEKFDREVRSFHDKHGGEHLVRAST